MRIGLTGTIGSGKSLVASALEELGAVVIDTDIIAREVVRPFTPGWLAVVAAFGPDILAPDKFIDRKKLADIVFKDESRRRTLNRIMHPLIGLKSVADMMAVPRGKHSVLVVPLLFESGFEKLVQQVWVVAADENILVERIRERDGATAEHAEARIASQMPQGEKVRRADVVIYNNGTIEETIAQVREA